MKILVLIMMFGLVVGCKGFSLGEFGYDNKEQKVIVKDLNIPKSDEITDIPDANDK